MASDEKQDMEDITEKDEKPVTESKNDKLADKEKLNSDKDINKEESSTPTKLTINPIFNLDHIPTTTDKKVEKPKGEPVSFKVVYNKTKYDVEFPLEGTVMQLKEHLFPIIQVLPSMQKVMIKGLAKDEQILKELGVTKGAKIMVIGSKLNDVVSVNVPDADTSKAETSVPNVKEPLSRQKMHKKIIDKGVPGDATPGIKNCKDTLPPHPISGMVNKLGGKVRLTFKLELDQVWVGTRERTQKINMTSIHQVVSEPIEGHEEYHILGLQFGPTESSRYWVYWVPAQYVDAIKETILGK